jgi:4'-phosphopantetheinyl transferase EntD
MISLQNLFPPAAQCVFSDQPPDSIDLLPDETAATGNMRSARLREFAHGRHCAHKALSRFGLGDRPVPVGGNREPVWPDGVVGSISHAGDYAAVVVASDSDCIGIGIDLEINEALEPALVSMLCRPEELDRIRGHRRDSEGKQEGGRENDPALTKLIFSAKESVFKCIWPRIRRFVDFDEIEIQIDESAQTFLAVPHSGDLPRDLLANLRGRYARTATLIATGAYIQGIDATS